MHKNNSLKMLFIIGVLSLIFSGILYIYLNNQSEVKLEIQSRNEIEKVVINNKDYEELLKFVYEYNKKLPQEIDEYTRLDKIKIEKMTIIYNHTILVNSSDLDSSTFPKIKEEMKKNGIEELCTNKKTKPLLNMGISYKRKYRTQDNKYAFLYIVSGKDCDDTIKTARVNEQK